jgi:hypothetical protein
LSRGNRTSLSITVAAPRKPQILVACHRNGRWLKVRPDCKNSWGDAPAPKPGHAQFCTIRSYLSTAVKDGRALFDALVRHTEGRSWLPETG